MPGVREIAREDWKGLFALLDRVLEVEPAEREGWLASLRGDEAPLVPALRELLALPPDAGDVLRALPRFTAAPSAAARPAAGAPGPGDTVGPYRLVRELGRGGMAVVWLAERSDGAFKRTVALKLPHVTWQAGWAERLARERDILAGLEHPNVARLYDAGVDELGRPFMAMEYVEGRPLDVYCRERALPIRDRLLLVLEVARGVSYAHSRLVVHRDLKPGNVLAAADGSVHLLDFGIAGLLQGGRAAGTVGGASRLLTPEYASPEQVRGEPIGTASDVYSLAVVTYELLTGGLPYRLQRASAAEVEEAVAAADPRPPSEAAADPASRRELRGDLDAILGKALRKDPADRYATVDAFADDLRRHLAGEAVLARPDRRLYRLRRFAARHRLGLAAASLVAVVLVAATVVSLREARAAAEERNRALRLLARNQAMSEFVSAMLTEVATPDRSVTVDDLLERSESLVFSATTRNPEHQAVILQMLSSYYGTVGDRGKAESLLARALTLAAGSDDALLVATLACHHAYAESELGRVGPATATIDGVLARSAGSPDVAAICLQRRAAIARDTNDAAGALRYALQARAQLARARQVDATFEAGLLGDLAYAHHLNGQNAEAEALFTEALARFEAIGRQEHPDVVRIRIDWGLARYASGNPLGALDLFDRALAIATRHASGGEPPLALLADRALTLDALARYDEARASFARVAEIGRRRGDDAAVAFALVGEAKVCLGQGDVPGARQRLAQSLAGRRDAVPAETTGGTNTAVLEARMAAAEGRLPEAEAAFSRIVAFWDARQVRTGATWSALRDRSGVYLREGRLEDALADARRAEEIARAVQGATPFSSLTGLSLGLLSDIHERAGRRDEARRTAREAVPHLVHTLGDAHPETRHARARAEA
jgi:tetratricopeptide (TPR) repeat protein/predicted Ser/Thr protein kinase